MKEQALYQLTFLGVEVKAEKDTNKCRANGIQKQTTKLTVKV